MTFEQDLNQWCKESEKRLNGLEIKIKSIQDTQKLLIGMLTANMALLGIVIAAIAHL